MTERQRPLGALPPNARETLLRKALDAGLDRTSSNSPPVTAIARSGPAPLSFGQQRMWFLCQLDEKSTAYHVDDGVRLDGDLDVATFKAALDGLVIRHGALRTRFTLVDGEPMQWVAPETGERFAIVEEDLSAHPDQPAAIDAAIQRFSTERFDLYRGPLARALLLRLGPSTHLLMMTLHHIVCDGWSIGILVRDLGRIYAALAAGERAPEPAMPTIDYMAYAEWQRRTLHGEAIEQQLAYWVRTLAHAPALLPLPTDRPRSRKRDQASASRAFDFDTTLTQRLHAMCVQRRMTVYMAMLAAWAIALARLSGERDMIVATPVANRPRLEFEAVVGLFVNTLPLRIDLSSAEGVPTIDTVLTLVRACVLEAQSHQDVPFERIVQAVGVDRHTSYAPLLQLLFAWQEQPLDALRVAEGLSISPYKSVHRVGDSEIVVSIAHTAGAIAGHIAYSSALYDASTIDTFIEAWQCVLEAMADDPSRSIYQVPLMAEASKQRLLIACNANAPSDGETLLVHERIAAHARATPAAAAIVQDGNALSYGELDDAADRLARRLRAAGVGPDALVALAAGKSAATIVGMLATLKAGGAYLPLDMAWPRAALSRALEQGSPVAVLVDYRGRDVLLELMATGGARLNLPLVDLTTDEHADENAAHPQRLSPACSHNLAYAICTSGSTGRPKLVLAEHRNLSSLLGWQEKAYPLAPGARVSSVSNLAFDAAAWEIWTALCSGAALYLPPQSADALTLDELLHWWVRQPLDTSFLPTPVAEYAFARNVVHPTLRTLFVGGDRLRSLPRAISAALVDLYGPTETTVLAIAGQVDLLRTRASLGRPTSHSMVYVLDPNGEPVPVGVPGEIHIGGQCVARGYLGEPARSAARFLPDPFSPVPGARLYATGDIASWLPDGTVAFVGRNAHQLKVAGVRVDLSAIESRLAEHPAVREALVVARHDEGNAGEGNRMLVAYVVPVSVASPFDAAALRRHLAEHLPPYLIPAAFVPLEEWRLDANGKLDRAGLPAPGAEHRPPSGTQRPVGEYEIAVARLWCELLRLPAVSRDDDFFALGGYSLLCAVMNHRLYAAFGVDIGIRYLYESRTLRGVAERLAALCVERAKHTIDADVDRPARDAELRVADSSVVLRAQRRIWLACQSEAGQAAYHVGFKLAIEGALSVSRLRSAVEAAMRRHPSLRATFVEAPTGIVRSVCRQIPDVVVDRTAAASHRVDNERCANAPFDLARGPLVRVVACREGSRNIVYAVLHHILTDGVGAQRFIQAILAGYANGAVVQPDQPGSDDDHAQQAARERRYFSSEAYEADLEYWRNRLAGYNTRPAILPDFRPAQGQSRAVNLSGSANGVRRGAVHARSRALGCTPHQFLLACAFVALRRSSGRDDLAISIPVHLRDHARQFDSMGLFINMLPIRPRLDDCHSVAQYAHAVREAFDEAYPHKRAPFEDIAETIESGAPPGALMSTLFVHTEVSEQAPRIGEPEISLQSLPSPGAKCDFNLFAAEGDHRVSFSLEFDADRFSWLTAQALLDGFEETVHAALECDSDGPAYSASDALRVQRWRDTVATLLMHPSDRPFDERDVAWAQLSAPLPVAAARERAECALRELMGSDVPVYAISSDEPSPCHAGAGEPPHAAFGAKLVARPSAGVLECVLAVEGGRVCALGVVADPRYCFGRFGAEPIMRDIAAALRGAALQPVRAPHAWHDGQSALVKTGSRHHVAEPRLRVEWPDAGRDSGWRIAETNAGPVPRAAILAALAITLYRYTGQREIAVDLVELDDSSEARVRALSIACDPTSSAGAMRQAIERAVVAAKPSEFPSHRAAQGDGKSLRVQITQSSAKQVPGATLSRICVSPERGIYVHLRDDGVVRIAIDAGYFDTGFAARFTASFERVLTRMHDADTPISAIDACGDAEPAHEMRDARTTLVSGFIEQARLIPNAPALQCGDRRIEYATLLRNARGAAAALHGSGLRSSSLVAILLDDPLDYACAIVAVALAGAAYLPLDAGWPPLRREAVLRGAQPDLVIADARSLEGAAGQRTLTWPLSAPSHDDTESQDAQPAQPPASPDDLAYVIYTSGSTGAPKGVAMTHGAAANTILDVNRRVGLSASDAIYAVSSFAFDLSVYDLFGALTAGAKIVFPQSIDRLSPSAWLRDLRDTGVTVWNSVPALAELLVEQAHLRPVPTLRSILLSGDRIPVALPDRLRRTFSPTHLLSLGGATEAGIWSIAHRLDGATSAGRPIPYGEPLAGQHFLVLDADDQPCPPGVPGELNIGGAGLALGYWRAEEETARAFFRYGSSATRLYRTGDVGYRRVDGIFEILGRLDDQIKIHGYRIEIGDVEAALRMHPGIADARVWLDGDGSHTHLVAAVCADEDVAMATLPDFVAARLPQAMRPARYIRVARWPLTSNGKVDAAALRSAARATEPVAPVEMPRTPREATLLELWRTLLGLNASQPLGVHDDFFDVGGHSLLALRMLERLNRQAPTVPYRTFLAHTTVAALAGYLDAAEHVADKTAAQKDSAVDTNDR
ncbi:amino acid adenylation domain-containing protein [Paraburkholderia caledonica]|uniref:Amino acid adenylation domain-containing protein n=1 Tax=Paraburkholderia caledonica TaxID=134536 RepID=A0AB73INJ1_9BURK|nr:amino acid adenylation domain-containing protein [Paraburkholderia caledonica]